VGSRQRQGEIVVQTSNRIAVGALVVALVSGCATTPAPTPAPATTASPTSSALPAIAPGEAWIAFQTRSAAGYGVHLVRPDGTGFHKWPAAIPGTHEHPDWSPDGTRILLNSIDADGTEDLWVADADGSDARRIVDCADPCVWVDEPSWSPDGTMIAFQRLVQAEGRLVSTLELMDVAAGTTSTVLTMPSRDVVLAPRWAPDGERLVVEAIRLLADDLESDLEGGAVGIVDLAAAVPVVERVTDWSSFANNPDWSRDDRLVYVQPSAANHDLADLIVTDGDGSAATPITDLVADGGSAIHPAFTPDGTQVLFVMTTSDRPVSGMATIGIDGVGLGSMTGGSWLDGTHPRMRPTD